MTIKSRFLYQILSFIIASPLAQAQTPPDPGLPILQFIAHPPQMSPGEKLLFLPVQAQDDRFLDAAHWRSHQEAWQRLNATPAGTDDLQGLLSGSQFARTIHRRPHHIPYLFAVAVPLEALTPQKVGRPYSQINSPQAMRLLQAFTHLDIERLLTSTDSPIPPTHLDYVLTHWASQYNQRGFAGLHQTLLELWQEELPKDHLATTEAMQRWLIMPDAETRDLKLAIVNALRIGLQKATAVQKSDWPDLEKLPPLAHIFKGDAATCESMLQLLRLSLLVARRLNYSDLEALIGAAAYLTQSTPTILNRNAVVDPRSLFNEWRGLRNDLTVEPKSVQTVAQQFEFVQMFIAEVQRMLTDDVDIRGSAEATSLLVQLRHFTALLTMHPMPATGSSPNQAKQTPRWYQTSERHLQEAGLETRFTKLEQTLTYLSAQVGVLPQKFTWLTNLRALAKKSGQTRR